MALRKKKTAGFSLIELLVTLTIATLVVGGVLLQFRIFDSVVVLKGLAYEMAFTLREAQVFAVSSGVSSDGFTFNNPYGVYVNLNNPQEYIFYMDDDATDGEIQYDSGDQIIETITLKDNFEISQICVDTDCSSPNEVSIAFLRPEFDAQYYALDSSSVAIGGMDSVSDVSIRIELASDASLYFDVAAGVTGQISVAAAP